MSFAPRLDVLPPAQRALWPALRAVPRRYVLYGGTALALRLAHRASVFNPLVAQKALCYFEGGDLDTLDEAARRRLTAEATRDLRLVPLALRSTRLD